MAESTTRTSTPSQANQNSKNGISTERSSGTGSGKSSSNMPTTKKKKGGGGARHDAAGSSGLAGMFASLCGGKRAKQAFHEEPLSSRNAGSRPMTGASQHSGSKAAPAAPVTTRQVYPDAEVTTTKRLSTGETESHKTVNATTRLPVTPEHVQSNTPDKDGHESVAPITKGAAVDSASQDPSPDQHDIQSSRAGIGKNVASNGHMAGNETASRNLTPVLLGATTTAAGAAVAASTSEIGTDIPQSRYGESNNAGQHDNTVNEATQKLNDLSLANDGHILTGHPLPLEEVRSLFKQASLCMLTFLFAGQTEGMTSAAVQPPGSGPTFVPALGPHAHHHHLTPHISPAATPISRTPPKSHSHGVTTGSTATSNEISDDSFLSDSTSSNERSSILGGGSAAQNGVGLGVIPNLDDNATPNQAYVTANPVDDDANEEAEQDDMNLYADGMDADDDFMDEEDRLIRQGGIGIPVGLDGKPAPLLPPISPEHQGRKCLVLDLDETLLHSSFKMIPSADFIVPVEIESQTHNVYVIKRPGVDMFLKDMGEIYEVVVFTASLSKYADPVLDMLDIHKVVKHRLFRESCYNHKGNYVKDLSQLGREIHTSIIIDNSPASYIFHPNNAVPVSTWFNDPHDTELTDLSPFLADLATVDDVRGVLDGQL
ncbi:hypothetical protein QFC19_005005 [Naganishia cerealis]|uniref:Uncharacterized protein n=1 Tax=Naganishia cerealis TaxID=610337 RepID=A0ACC2VSI5_9TREE|nr:hypothetical protein QFC19_005005 [Naganishia cerealis]